MKDIDDLLVCDPLPAEVAEKIASDPNETREDYIKRSEAEGLLIIFPAANELQIDLDNKTHGDVFNRSYEIFVREMAAQFGVGSVPDAKWTRSKGGSGWHVRITLPFDLDVWQRIAWQAALGSDPVREVLSCFRALRGDTAPTLLAEKPGYDE